MFWVSSRNWHKIINPSLVYLQVYFLTFAFILSLSLLHLFIFPTCFHSFWKPTFLSGPSLCVWRCGLRHSCGRHLCLLTVWSFYGTFWFILKEVNSNNCTYLTRVLQFKSAFACMPLFNFPVGLFRKQEKAYQSHFTEEKTELLQQVWPHETHTSSKWRQVAMLGAKPNLLILSPVLFLPTTPYHLWRELSKTTR